MAKEFFIEGTHFFLGSCKYDTRIDISNGALKKFAEYNYMVFRNEFAFKDTLRCDIVETVIRYECCNNWRKMHGLPMIRRSHGNSKGHT